MVDQAVITSVENYLHTCRSFGIDVQFGVIFGSFARDEAREWSDIDVLVISPQFDGERERAETRLLWRVAAYTDNRIEPVPCGVVQWEHDDSSPIIEIARREGVRVELPEKVAVQTIARAE